MWRANGTGTETFECGEIRDREPGEQGLVMSGSDSVSEGRWCGAEGVFGGE